MSGKVKEIARDERKTKRKKQEEKENRIKE